MFKRCKDLFILLLITLIKLTVVLACCVFKIILTTLKVTVKVVLFLLHQPKKIQVVRHGVY
ncbi:hypothetical protein D8X91_05765 [Listeria seeligeri]|nr:hypothetical protein [Listeria seeligeri]MBM5610578.1 hypothetical protein [Listeria seeligeri]